MQNIDDWKPSLFRLKGERLFVNWSGVKESSWLPTSLLADTFSSLIPEQVSGDLLDLGCGRVPYYQLYSKYAESVTCIDWANSPHENSFLDSSQDLNEPLQLGDGLFDVVLMSEVLEHVANTLDLLAEVHRVLRPGGRVIISVPFLYWLHEVPYDHYRFTCFGLRHLLGRAGFSSPDITVQGTWGAVFVDMFSKRIVSLPLVGKIFVRGIQSIAIRYFVKAKPKKNQKLDHPFPLAYVCVAVKPIS